MEKGEGKSRSTTRPALREVKLTISALPPSSSSSSSSVLYFFYIEIVVIAQRIVAA